MFFHVLFIEDTCYNKPEEQTASYIWTIKVQDFKKITHHSRGMYGIYLKQIKSNQKITTYNLESLGYWPIVPKNVPTHWIHKTGPTY